MIVAVILAGRTGPLIQGSSPYLLPLGDETVIERIARTVLRGPFGGTVVASAAAIHKEVRTALEGFAVQHVSLSADGQAGSARELTQALKFAEDFRARWEKAMAAAAERFGAGEDDDESDKPKKKKSAKGSGRAATATATATASGADWARHNRSADVKVRGLARSFQRDGVIVFRGDCPLITADLQAHMIDAFAREAATKGSAACPFAQAVNNGVRGFPVAIDREALRELIALPPQTQFDAWLLSQLPRIQDVAVQEALQCIANEADYNSIAPK